MCAAGVDWELAGPTSLSYAGHRSSRYEVAEFFAAPEETKQMQTFEPREFIEAGDNLTVLGFERATALDTGKHFESQWVHVFTVNNNKITRWRGFIDTAARYNL